MKKLSEAQQRFLKRVELTGLKGERTPFTGGRNAGRVANAWYRTARSLSALGLVWLEREGDAQRAWARSVRIKVERESKGLTRFGTENCCFCHKPTRFWVAPLTKTSVACCEECAGGRKAFELPTKAEWCEQEAQREPCDCAERAPRYEDYTCPKCDAQWVGEEREAVVLPETAPQSLLFVGDWDTKGVVPKAAPVRCEREPKRVWTLQHHTTVAGRPELPFAPVHLTNAFLEDKIHDWNWRAGVLTYRSRVADGPVWLLLEY